MHGDDDVIWEALGEYRGPLVARTFVRYCVAKYNDRIMELSYRAYVTESLRLAPQMMYLTGRWIDTIYGKGRDDRSADEIVDDVIGRLNGD